MRDKYKIGDRVIHNQTLKERIISEILEEGVMVITELDSKEFCEPAQQEYWLYSDILETRTSHTRSPEELIDKVDSNLLVIPQETLQGVVHALEEIPTRYGRVLLNTIVIAKNENKLVDLKEYLKGLEDEVCTPD